MKDSARECIINHLFNDDLDKEYIKGSSVSAEEAPQTIRFKIMGVKGPFIAKVMTIKYKHRAEGNHQPSRMLIKIRVRNSDSI